MGALGRWDEVSGVLFTSRRGSLGSPSALPQGTVSAAQEVRAKHLVDSHAEAYGVLTSGETEVDSGNLGFVARDLV